MFATVPGPLACKTRNVAFCKTECVFLKHGFWKKLGAAGRGRRFVSLIDCYVVVFLVCCVRCIFPYGISTWCSAVLCLNKLFSLLRCLDFRISYWFAIVLGLLTYKKRSDACFKSLVLFCNKDFAKWGAAGQDRQCYKCIWVLGCCVCRCLCSMSFTYMGCSAVAV